MATSKIKSDSIDTIAATKLTGTITPSADAVTGAQIADNAINSEHYTDGSIDTAKIADVNVTTGKIADDAITLAKMAAGTDGNIISYDASGNPVAIATGTDGQVLTSTGAGSPPAFEAVSSVTDLKFLGQNGAEISNQLGDENLVTVTFATERYDTGSDYSNTTFTAAETGKYLLIAQVEVINLATNMDELMLRIVTSNFTYRLDEYNPNRLDTKRTWNISCIADMDATDTAYVDMKVTGGSRVADIQQYGTTFFCGALLA